VNGLKVRKSANKPCWDIKYDKASCWGGPWVIQWVWNTLSTKHCLRTKRWREKDKRLMDADYAVVGQGGL